MTEIAVSVKPGLAPTLLQINLGHGALLVNTDSVNGVWISESPSVAPGQGAYLGPLGSINWNNSNVLAYACLDTGGVAPVNVTISDNATNPDNPVAIGAAIAAKLLVTGVPQVFQQATIAALTQDMGVTTTTGKVDVSAYASLVLNLQLPGNPIVCLKLLWYSDLSSNPVYTEFLTGNFITPPVIKSGAWSVPVRAQYLQIVNTDPGFAAGTSLTTIGTNRLTTKTSQLGSDTTVRVFGYNSVVLGAGAIQPMPNLDTATLGDYSKFNRAVTIQYLASAVGTLYFEFVNPTTGAASWLPLFTVPTANVHALINWSHPIGPVRWAYAPTGAGTITAQIYVSGSDGVV